MLNISNIDKTTLSHTLGFGSMLLRKYGACLLLLALTGCSTANLLSEKSRKEFQPITDQISEQQLRQSVLETIDPNQSYQQGKTMEVTATDIWKSTLVRWLTPLDENKQEFKARLKLYHQGVEFTFLNGDKKGQTIGFDGQSYKYIGPEKIYEESSSTSLYLGPLQSYIEWGQTLLRNPSLELLGTKDINNIPYRVVYVTDPPAEKLDDYDQYLIYINTQTGKIDYVEFTMRELMKSYRGVVHYRDYKMVEGVLMPFWIGIADGLEKPDFDHYFVITAIRFSSSE